MLRPYLKIWDWEWIFGRAVKAISSLVVRSPCRALFHKPVTFFCAVSYSKPAQANDSQNIDFKIYIHHRSSNEINLNNRNAFTNVTLIASNLGARDVIVHFEIVFILFFYLPFCRLSILKPGATLLKCGFSKFPHVRTIIFWDHIFPRISLVNFEPSAVSIQKKLVKMPQSSCQEARISWQWLELILDNQ